MPKSKHGLRFSSFEWRKWFIAFASVREGWFFREYHRSQRLLTHGMENPKMSSTHSCCALCPWPTISHQHESGSSSYFLSSGSYYDKAYQPPGTELMSIARVYALLKCMLEKQSGDLEPHGSKIIRMVMVLQNSVLVNRTNLHSILSEGIISSCNRAATLS